MDSSASKESVRRYGSRKTVNYMERPAVLDTRFFIPNKHFKLIWDVSKPWHKYSHSVSGIMSHQIVSLFNRAFQLGVGITKDPKDAGDIVAVWYKGFGGLNDMHERFFRLIAKYVQEGSYINVMKSDRPDYTEQCVKSGKALEETITYAQWYFNGDVMIEKKGELVFK